VAHRELAHAAIVAVAAAAPLLLALAGTWLILGLRIARDKAERENGPRVAAQIVRRHIDDALTKYHVETLIAGEKLLTQIDLFFGPFISSSGEFRVKIAGLKTALAGTIKEDAEPPAQHPDPRHPDLFDGAPPPGASSSAAAAGGAASASASIGGAQITVVAPASGKHEPKTRDATTKEHIQKVREALVALSEFWDVDRLIPQLRQLQTALLHAEMPEPEDGERPPRRRSVDPLT
jgi:hypothetical protein